MPITVKLGETEHSIYRRTVQDLVIHGKDTALKNLGWFENNIADPVRSLFGAKTNEQILNELDRMIRQGGNAPKGADIVMGLAVCDQLKKDNAPLYDFLSRVQVSVNNHQAGSDVALSIAGKNDSDHIKKHTFAAPVVLPNQLFKVSSGNTYQLKPEVVGGTQLQTYAEFLSLFKIDARDEAIRIMNDLARVLTSEDFENGILKLETLVDQDKKADFYQNVRLKITREGDGSVVNLFLNDRDDLSLIKVTFEGEYKPNDRLFAQEKGNTNGYSLTPIPLNLKPVVDRIIDPTLLNSTEQNYKRIVKLNCEVEEANFIEMAGNMGRAINTLSTTNKKDSEVDIKDEVDDRSFTKAKLTELIVTHLSDADAVINSIDAVEFGQEFLQLSFKDQRNFLSNSNELSEQALKFQKRFLKIVPIHQPLLKQALFLLNPKLLVADEMLKAYQENLLNLSTEDQNKFPLKFAPIEFKGSITEFKKKIDAPTVSIEEKAVFLIMADQFYQTPLDGFSGEITRDGGRWHQLKKIDGAALSLKLLPSDPERPALVKLELRAHHEFKQSDEEHEFVGDVVAHQDLAVIYQVQFTESKNLDEARVELSDYKLESLVIHNEDGSIPKVCKNISTESEGERGSAIHGSPNMTPLPEIYFQEFEINLYHQQQRALILEQVEYSCHI